ncbi:hypothetical protein TNIN_52701 [Trichonephila inaurata madagascariensis]|uniref:Uncharacterized protein n=1 Tax=Trichonephila inaurata madagascariensis TaxID=2747483 RepID=A0A8X6WTU5_9ARAC|nr:hypothetical protein TNIN_52701 [Trichonephila inaurata madagascariensis]
MTDLCFICNESLSQGDPVNVVRGLKTLKTASMERNDGHIDFLNSSIPENVHTECRKTNFLNRLPCTEKKPRQDNQVSEAMAEIFNHIENHDDSQFTLKELRDVLTGYVSFIDHPASNVDTVYTTLHCATNIALRRGQKTCLITFDQPLYSGITTLKFLLL